MITVCLPIYLSLASAQPTFLVKDQLLIPEASLSLPLLLSGIAPLADISA